MISLQGLGQSLARKAIGFCKLGQKCMNKRMEAYGDTCHDGSVQEQEWHEDSEREMRRKMTETDTQNFYDLE